MPNDPGGGRRHSPTCGANTRLAWDARKSLQAAGERPRLSGAWAAGHEREHELAQRVVVRQIVVAAGYCLVATLVCNELQRQAFEEVILTIPNCAFSPRAALCRRRRSGLQGRVAPSRRLQRGMSSRIRRVGTSVGIFGETFSYAEKDKSPAGSTVRTGPPT